MTGSLEVQVLYPAWWRRRVSEAQGRRREAGPEGSVEQSRDPRDTNRIARPTQPDERAGDREVHGHQGRGATGLSRSGTYAPPCHTNQMNGSKPSRSPFASKPIRPSTVSNSASRSTRA